MHFPALLLCPQCLPIEQIQDKVMWRSCIQLNQEVAVTVMWIVTGTVVKYNTQTEQAGLLKVVSLIVTWHLVVAAWSYKGLHCTFHGSQSSEVVCSSNYAVVCKSLLAYWFLYFTSRWHF